ncbi:MAG: phosphatase PAP2 family protein [Lachnospiraceae bacterium]|nr:phosphatase PAP2 family protein [Lachnospiraceae bacterium]
MQKPFYDRLARPFEADEQKKRRLTRSNDIVSKAFYITYPVLLAVLALMRDARVIRVLLVPLLSFLAVTIFRKAVNAPRPYEIWSSPPLIPKDTKGNSFPSRHVFCVFIIAMAAAYVCKPAAIVMMAAGVFLAVVRVIARIHFIRDVVAGALIAIILGWVGFWVI